MEQLSRGKILAKWLRDKIKSFSLYLVFSMVFIITTVQYRVSLEPVLYSMLMCTFLGICYMTYSFIQYESRCRALYETHLNVDTTLSTLPEPSTYLETLYGEVLQKLYDNRSDLYAKMKKQELESTDYYTLWIHQIKTPIAALHLLFESENSAQNTMLMKQELFKIEQYAEMALHYLRLQYMSLDILLKECNLYEIVKQCVKKYSINFIEKKLSLNFKEFQDIVISDEKWLGFVIEQILSNCIKYTPKGCITINYVKKRGQIDTHDNLQNDCRMLCISDTGIGIKEEDLPRIFEKGFTGYNGRRDKKSTGIGLYLCKEITKKLGFEINVTSEVGKGTMFQIDFGIQNDTSEVGKLD